MLSARRSLLFFAIITILEIEPAGAEDLAAGKSAPQLFATNCSMCHSTPRNLPRRTDNSSLAEFLQEHYTTSQTSAYKLAGYLSVVGGSARRGKQQSVTSVSSQVTAPAPLRPPANVPSR
jgi:cytochrome c553